MILIFIAVIMVMRVVQSIYSKKTSVIMPKGLKSYVLFIAVNYGIAALFAATSMVLEGDFSNCEWNSVLVAACSGMFLVIGTFCGIKALQGGTMALNSVCSAAGLIIPCVIGIFVFNEPISIIQWLCIAAVLVSAGLLIDSSKSIYGVFSAKTLIYLVLSFASNGMTMFCQKLFKHITPDGNVSLFSLFTFLIPSVILFVLFLFMPSVKEKAEKLFPKKLFMCAFMQAFAVFIINQFVTTLTPIMDSAVLFTTVNGCTPIIAALVGRFMYSEKITVKTCLGMLIGICALVLIQAAA